MLDIYLLVFLNYALLSAQHRFHRQLYAYIIAALCTLL